MQKLLGEQCEQSLHNLALPYDCKTCRFASRSCGNKAIDLGEECDDGQLNSTSPNARCRPDCSLARCGDGILDSEEKCDDGNRRNGDGCGGRCDKETTLVASDFEEESKSQTQNSNSLIAQQFNSQQLNNQLLNNQQHMQFPYSQTLPYPSYQLPFASLQPLIQQAPQTAQSGPAAVAIIGAGAAAGLSWVRRKRK